MSALSPTQKGIVAEHEFAKLLTLGSNGDLELVTPMTDDERRDLEAHRRGQFASLVFQVKSTTYLEHRFKARHFSIHFLVERDRLIEHPRFWYLFAYLDLEAMAFGDPVFLAPSAEVHAHAVPHLRKDIWNFSFEASLDRASRDRWQKYQVAPRDVGKKVLKVLETVGQQAAAPKGSSPLRLLEGGLWVRRQPGPRRSA